jgi:hypothetical protein
MSGRLPTKSREWPLRGWPATPKANLGWARPPPKVSGVVAPPPAPYMGWLATPMGGRPASEGFDFYFLF